MARVGGKARPTAGAGKPGRSAATLPRVSVVMPVRNGARFIAAAIEGLRRSSFQSYELIVVDDASSDGSGELAQVMGATVLRPAGWGGAAAARMAGVARARGQILAFIDADVVVHPEALARLVERLDAEPQVAAVIGAYDDAPSAPAVLSRFRNLLHTWFHRRADPDARTFWTGLGAIRRPAFEAVGGFSNGLLDDVELGLRLHAAGHRIALDPAIQGTHLKDWSFLLMVETDILLRGAPWIRLALERGFFRNDLNTSAGQRASVAAAGALLAVVAIGGLMNGLPFLATVAGAAFALSIAAWGDAERAPPSARARLGLSVAGAVAAGGLWLAGAWPAALVLVAAVVVRIFGRPAYRPKPNPAALALSALIGAAVALSILASAPSPWGLAALALAALYAGLSWPILAFMAGRMGPLGGVAALPLLFVYHVSCGLAVAVGLAGHLAHSPNSPWKMKPAGTRA